MTHAKITADLLMAFYRALRKEFGYRNWWPADTAFEVCVGAILTQNTSWKNVSKAIASLRACSALDTVSIHELTLENLSELIRPAGYFNVKARRLRNFVNYVVEKYGGDLSAMLATPPDQLRAELLSLNGVGKETADSMILYAAKKPVFVVDAYTRRVLYRHGLIEEKLDYDAIQDLFHSNLERDTELFNDFHAQLVAVGHYYCKRTPLCHKCPLQQYL